MNTKKFFTTTLLGATIFLFSGCEDLVSAISDTSSGHDSISVTQLNATTLQFSWEKKYSGYSEVLSRESGVSRRTGYFMTQNAKGSYELTCSINDYSSDSVKLSCTNTGSGYLSTFSSFPKMKFNTNYNIEISEGTSHDYRGASATIRYNEASNSLQVSN